MKRFFRCLLVIIITMSMLLTACGKSEKAQQVEGEAEDKILIGFSFDTFVMERWERDRDVFVSRANALGADVNVQCANGDPVVQKQQIQYFIDIGCDIIVIVAIDCNDLVDEVVRAHDAGILVVSYDRLIANAESDLYITFDNTKVGQLMGDYIYENVGDDAQVIMINGALTDSNVAMVSEGFEEVAKEHDFKILDTVYCDNWDQELGYEYIINNLSLVKRADAIMCGNDAIACRVIQALSENRMAGSVLVVGQDAEIESCQHIVDGTQAMTVYKPVDNLAEAAADYVVGMLNGEDLDLTGSISDGNYYIPYIALEPYAVTEENMDELIIDSGFHHREDVYLYE